MNVKDARTKVSIVYLGYLPNIVLLVALGFGLYTEWVNSQNLTVFMISVCGLFIFAVSCALQYYFNMETMGKALLHIWLGYILGIIIFEDSSEYQYESLEEAMNILLITSAIIGWFWSICARVLQLYKHEIQLFSFSENLESLGMIIAALVMGTVDSIALTLFVLSFIINLTAIRLKSILGLLTLIVLFVVVAFVFLPTRNMQVNVYGIMCFAGRHLFDPIVDLYFSGFSTLERWQAFLSKTGIARRFVIIVIFVVNFASVALIGRPLANHKEWFVVIPIYAVLAIFWLCFHIIYMITTWKLMNKITECNITYNGMLDNHRSMNRVMASKGIRHFSLISRRIIFITLITTLLVAAVGWETKTCDSIGLLMLVLPVEAMTLSLFWELGDNLGGTCTGYALISPYTGQQMGSGAKLLPASVVQDIGSRATATLNKIQQFFNLNMVDNFGCDFSSSGIAEDYIKSKVAHFFDRRTADGPRYDTYLLYYSGDSHESGDWALTGNGSLKLDTLLEWWTQKNGESGSRLILVCDTHHSWRWAQEVAKISDDFVALQTCKFTRPPDPEFGEKLTIGAFTNDWVDFNLGIEIDLEWSDKERVVRAIYKVSRSWTDFTFHLPTPEDIEQHWNSSFPKVTKPLIKAVNFMGTGSLCCCCDSIRKCFKRKKMQWLPPKVSDSGHGFKLVRS